MRIESDNPWPVTDDDTRPIGSPDACCWCKAKLGQQHKLSCAVRQRTVVIDATICLVRKVPEDWKPDEIEYGMNHARWCATNILGEFDNLAKHARGCLCDFFTGHYVREATSEDEEKFGVWAVQKREKRMRFLKQADKTHDWVKDAELPWCVNCGMSKISAHIWGDDEWTKEPIACPKYEQVLSTQD